MTEEEYIEACAKAQREYLDKNNYPHFSPISGFCYKCGRQIYGTGPRQYSLRKASSESITDCPHCNYSFC